jgi:hypothetical protein
MLYGDTAPGATTSRHLLAPSDADRGDVWTSAGEFASPDDEAFDDEEQARTTIRARVGRAVGLVLVIALLSYFIVPFGRVSWSTRYRQQLPGGAIRPIPVTPERPSHPKVPV